MNEQEINSVQFKILQAVKKQPITEKKIVKSSSLNNRLVADQITELMLRGYIERNKIRRFRYFKVEYFSITLEGVEALQIAERDQFDSLLSELIFNAKQFLPSFSLSISISIISNIIKIVRSILK